MRGSPKSWVSLNERCDIKLTLTARTESNIGPRRRADTWSSDSRASNASATNKTPMHIRCLSWLLGKCVKNIFDFNVHRILHWLRDTFQIGRKCLFRSSRLRAQCITGRLASRCRQHPSLIRAVSHLVFGQKAGTMAICRYKVTLCELLRALKR